MCVNAVRGVYVHVLLYMLLLKSPPPPPPMTKSAAPRVSRSWGSTVDMRAQRLRDLGFLVLKCDNRGSFRRYILYYNFL